MWTCLGDHSVYHHLPNFLCCQADPKSTVPRASSLHTGKSLCAAPCHEPPWFLNLTYFPARDSGFLNMTWALSWETVLWVTACWLPTQERAFRLVVCYTLCIVLCALHSSPGTAWRPKNLLSWWTGPQDPVPTIARVSLHSLPTMAIKDTLVTTAGNRNARIITVCKAMDCPYKASIRTSLVFCWKSSQYF